MNPPNNSDVLIIGGGVIGLSLARALRRRGVGKITILERNAETGREASDAAAGMLATQSETDQDDDFFRFCADSNKLYTQFSAQLFDETGIDIQLETSGTLYLAFTEKDVAEIRRRFSWQEKAGLNVRHLTAEEARRSEPFISPETREALFFPNDWQVDNRLLVAALQKFARSNEIEIVAGAEVKNLLTESGRITGAQTITEKFYAAQTVLATGAWTAFIKAAENALLVTRIMPIRGQVSTLRFAKRVRSEGI